MKKRITSSIILFTLLFTTFISPIQSFAGIVATDSITKALQWIQQNQETDGSWGVSLQEKSLTTATVAKFLSNYNYLSTNYNVALSWIKSDTNINNTKFARHLNIADMATADKIANLVSIQSESGGWGVTTGGSNDNLTTALALNALLNTTGYDKEASLATFHLLSTQNADGSWGLVKDSPGSVYLTGIVRSTLLVYQEKTRNFMSTELNNAAEWLISKKVSNGNWGAVDLTYMAFQGLAKDRWQEVKDIPSYLLSIQHTNGSWNNDPYQTALALDIIAEESNVHSVPQIKEVKLIVDGLESNTFNTEAKVEIVPLFTGRNITPQVSIISPSGEKTVIPSDVYGRYFWNTDLNSAGTYTVEVNLKNESGQIVSTNSKPLNLSAYLNNTDSALEVTPGASLVGKPVSPSMRLLLKTETNIVENVDVICSVYDSENNLVYTNTVTTTLNNGESAIELGSFTADTSSEANYSIKAEILHQGSLMAKANASYRVLEEINSLYTTNLDFDRGTLWGVNYNEVADQLQLNKDAAVFPYIWIANAGEGTVSKIDTRTGKEVGRYRVGASPSRTAVDKDGNCWVANREDGTVVKIAMDGGVDKNNNGKIDTSKDLNGNGRIDANEILPFGQDEAILAVVKVGSTNSIPRALAIDKEGRIWVGLYNDRKYVVVDPETYQLTGTSVSVPANPYGAAIDSNGYLWSSGRGTPNRLDQVNTNNNTFVASYNIGVDPYGVVVDKNGIVWVAGYSTNYLVRFNPATKKYTNHTGSGSGGRGVAVDRDGNIWVAYSINNTVSKFNPNGGHIFTISIGNSGGSNPIGVGVDGDGYIWVTCNSSNNTFKISTDGKIEGVYATGSGPYTYSDMTGFNLQNVTAHEGKWTVTHDSGTDNFKWNKVLWNSQEPKDTSVTVKARAANDIDSLNNNTYVIINNNEAITGLSGRFLQMEVKLATSTVASPIVEDVEILGIQGMPIAVAGEDQTIDSPNIDWAKLILDGTNSYDPNGLPLTYKWTWNGGQAFGPQPSILLPVGTTKITLVVNNGLTDSLPSTVNYTVIGPGGLTTAPAMPTNVIATATSSTITLKWQEVLGATGYEVDLEGFEIDNQLDTIFIDTGLSPKTQYTYRVRSKNSSGFSDWSEPIVVTTLSVAEEVNKILTKTEALLEGIKTLEKINDAQTTLNTARELIPSVTTEEDKVLFQTRINTLQNIIDVWEFTAKLVVLEETADDLAIQEATKGLLEKLIQSLETLPLDENEKSALYDRLVFVQNTSLQVQAELKVGIAEKTINQDEVNMAQEFVDRMISPTDKNILQERLNLVQNVIDTTKQTSLTEKEYIVKLENLLLNADLTQKQKLHNY